MCSERRKLSKKVLGAIVFAVVVVIVVIVVVVLAVINARLGPFAEGPNTVHFTDDGLHAYATAGEMGCSVYSAAALSAGATNPTPATTVAPPGDSGSIDDLALADGFLFALDARDCYLSVFSLVDPAAPTLVSGPVEVDCGPYTGVGAAEGKVVVSGGTSDMFVFSYDASTGALGATHSAVDLGQGQPDVSVAGQWAFVSTHIDGDEFGVTFARLQSPPSAPNPSHVVHIAGAGFSDGVSRPASFPIQSVPHVLPGPPATSLLLVATGSGLTIFNITDDPTASIAAIAQLNVGAPCTSVGAHGSTAYLTAIEPAPELIVVNIGDPTNPDIVDEAPLPPAARPLGVASNGDVVLVAADTGGLLVLSAAR